jgi:putative membrane protein insertion efficiency factor
MMLRAIVWYQRGAEGRLSPCRYFPSCSEYGHEAIAVHGAGRGLWLTIRRLARCRPFGPSGYDPVPLRADLGADLAADLGANFTADLTADKESS